MGHYLKEHHHHQDISQYQPLQDYQHQPHVKQLDEEILELLEPKEEQQHVMQRILKQLFPKYNNLP